MISCIKSGEQGQNHKSRIQKAHILEFAFVLLEQRAPSDDLKLRPCNMLPSNKSLRASWLKELCPNPTVHGSAEKIKEWQGSAC